MQAHRTFYNVRGEPIDRFGLLYRFNQDRQMVAFHRNSAWFTDPGANRPEESYP